MTIRTRALLVSMLAASPVLADLEAIEVAGGLDEPMLATYAPGDPNGLYIAERDGAIFRLDLTDLGAGPQPFLSIPGINAGGEGGLLGLAFHPDYATNGKIYVNLTTSGTGGNALNTVIREYTPADGLASAKDVLTIGQPQDNHNGGWIGFNPQAGPGTESYLYIGVGDGGNGNDEGTGHTNGTGNAQDLTNNLLGKMLRLDIDGDDFAADATRNYAIPASNPFVGVTGDDEIFAYGLRNPFRNSFDRDTGELYIGDVGQGQREEIDVIASGSPGGENFGWRLREGDIQTPGVGGAEPADYVAPIYDYTHGTAIFQGFAVTGGIVYRGPGTTLAGKYIFGDYVTERIWTLDPADPDGTVTWFNRQIDGFTDIDNIVAFGEDTMGRLYIVDKGGQVFHIYEIVAGDTDNDSDVDNSDLQAAIANFTGPQTDPPTYTKLRTQGDTDEDGDVDNSDLQAAIAGFTGPNPAVNAVPEPASLALLGLSGLALLRRRR